MSVLLLLVELFWQGVPHFSKVLSPRNVLTLGSVLTRWRLTDIRTISWHVTVSQNTQRYILFVYHLLVSHVDPSFPLAVLWATEACN